MRPSLPLTAAAAEPRATHPHCHQQSVQARRAGPSGQLMPAAATSCAAPLALPAAHALALVLPAAGAAASCSLRSGQQPIHPSGPCERLSPSAINACLPAQQRLAPPAPPPATGAPQWAMRTLAREVGREAGRLLQRHAALHGCMASWMRPSLPPRQRQLSPMPLTRMTSSDRRDSVGLADASPAGLTMGYRRRLL